MKAADIGHLRRWVEECREDGGEVLLPWVWVEDLVTRIDLYERQLQEHVGAVCEKCGVDDACDGECVWIPNNAKGGDDEA